jgi:Protein of unknown function (DUF982)
MSRVWFPGAPVAVIDWAKRGLIRNVNSVESAAEELLKWPKNKKRDRAAIVITDAYAGKAKVEAAKKAFEEAAKEAGVWVQYRGPLA